MIRINTIPGFRLSGVQSISKDGSFGPFHYLLPASSYCKRLDKEGQ